LPSAKDEPKVLSKQQKLIKSCLEGDRDDVEEEKPKDFDMSELTKQNPDDLITLMNEFAEET